MKNAGGISASKYSQEACPEEKPKCTFEKQFFFCDKYNQALQFRERMIAIIIVTVKVQTLTKGKTGLFAVTLFLTLPETLKAVLK